MEAAVAAELQRLTGNRHAQGEIGSVYRSMCVRIRACGIVSTAKYRCVCNARTYSTDQSPPLLTNSPVPKSNAAVREQFDCRVWCRAEQR